MLGGGMGEKTVLHQHGRFAKIDQSIDGIY